MSDDGFSDPGGDEGGSFSDGGDDSGEGGGPLPPPCAICLGLVLWIMSCYGIWNNEGDYVKRKQLLLKVQKEAVKKSCGDGMNKIADKSIVFLECDFEKLAQFDDLKSQEGLKGFADLLKSSSGKQAPMYKWKSAMFLPDSKSEKKTVTVKPCDMGQSSCCKIPNSQGFNDFRRKYEGCMDYVGSGWSGQGAHSLAQLPETANIDDLGPFNNISTERYLLDSDPDVVDDEEPDERSLLGYRSISDEPRRLGNKIKKPKETSVKCSFECFQWRYGWISSPTTHPDQWPHKPILKKGTHMDYYDANNYPPANNFKDMASLPKGSYHGDLTIGQFEVIDGQTMFASADLWDNDKLWNDVTLKSKAGKYYMKMKDVMTTPKWQGQADVTLRSVKHDSDWDAETSEANENCIYSLPQGGYHVDQDTTVSKAGWRSWRQTQSAVGDLRMCLTQSGVTSATIVAQAYEIKGGNGKMGLRATDDLKPKDLGMASSGDEKGYMIRVNSKMSLEELLDDEKNKNEARLFAFRVLCPLVCWIAFYCCLSPIIWIIDQAGDCFENIPCVGGIIGGMFDCLETLANAIICCVSCMCSLIFMAILAAIAWVRFRPEIAYPLLGAAAVLLCCLCGLGYSRQGKEKTRRRKGSARQPQMSQAGPSQEMAAYSQDYQQGVQQQPYMGQPGFQPGMAQPMQAQMMQQQYMGQPGFQPGMAQPMMGQPGFQPGMAQPMMAQPMMAQPMVQNDQQYMQCQCPPGYAPGMELTVQNPQTGEQTTIQIPDGVQPGGMFMVPI